MSLRHLLNLETKGSKLVLCSRTLLAQARAFFVVCVGVLMPTLLVTQSNAAPIINSISPIFDAFNSATDQSIQTITITGSGFGTMSPYTGNSSDILFADCTGSLGIGFSAGFVGTNPGLSACSIPPGGGVDDDYGLIVNSWSDMQIVLGGIDYNGASSTFGTLVNGDTVEVLVFNPQTGAGPADITCTVGDGTCTAAPVSTIPEPPAFSLLGAGLLALVFIRRHRTPATPVP
jgi:hypothetical protein